MAKRTSAKAGSVEIRPGVGTLGMFKFMDYTMWHAVGEFVDNSIASWQQHRVSLEKAEPGFVLTVVISYDDSDGGELRIWDNAAGISASDYQRAFKPAERPDDQSSLSRYGMGMKTAACWFSDRWKVVSKALGERVERTVDFDIPTLVTGEVERIDPTTKTAKTADHYTELVLWQLNQLPKGRSIGKIKEHLSQMYRRFIDSGEVEIYWNDELLSHRERAVLSAPWYADNAARPKRLHWEKKLKFKLPKGEVVTGRALLFERGEQKAAGLHLFWRGRMIKGNLEDFYRPPEIFQFAGSYRVQRLLVELDLDEFSPTVDKKDFIWGRGGSSEADLLTALRKELNKAPLRLLDQADHYRAGKVDKTVKGAAGKAAASTAAALEERGSSQLTKQVSEQTTGTEPLPGPVLGPSAHEAILEVKVGGDDWRIAIQLSERPQDKTRWLEITERPSARRGGPRGLGIRISLVHPFTINFAPDSRSIALLVRLAAALAIAEITAREAGSQGLGSIRRNLNELLLNVFADS